MNTNWKQDPRLKGMNQQKLELLTTFAQEVESAPKDQLMSPPNGNAWIPYA